MPFTKGHIVSEETKQKISLAKMGHSVSNESRAKMRLAKIGKPSSAKGIHWSSESRERLKEIRKRQYHPWRGKHRAISEAHRQSIVRANKERIFTQEILSKMSLSHIGQVSSRKGEHLTDVTKEKLRLARAKQISPTKGKHHSELTKNKLRQAALRQHASGNLSITSISGKLFLDALENRYGIIIQREVRKANRIFDGAWHNYLFEIDSKYWHTLDKAKSIDKEKDIIAKQFGHTLIRLNLNSKQEISTRLFQYDIFLRNLFNVTTS